MDAIQLLRASIPSVEFTTDVIVGFPGETEEDFEDTVRFVEEARFLNVHIFPYSKRKGTPAALMGDQLPTDVKRQRLHRLEEVTARIRAERLREAIAREPRQAVLFETYENGLLQGHTASFLEVTVRANCPMHGETATVILTNTDGVRCFGVFEEEFHGA